VVTRHVSFRAFRSGAGFTLGVHQGTRVLGEDLAYGVPAGVLHHTDSHVEHPERRAYEWCAWLSPQVAPGFSFTSLVPSWNAGTPGDSWLRVEARVSADGVRWSRWYDLGTWAEEDTELHRCSRPGQDDDVASVDTDVLTARAGTTWSTYQLRVVLARRPGSEAVPTVRLLGAMVSALPDGAPAEVSSGGAAWGTELAVPPHSQQLHRGSYQQWADGGEAWCSPTSTAMLLEHWGLGPKPEEYAWVPESTPDRAVVNAVRHVFDHGYGAGNWAFNTAFAGHFATAFVTRLRSLAEAEQLVAAGIPLVASVAFPEGDLDGAGYGTEGHLLTVIGFTETGDVVSNDPASHQVPSNDEVRVVYERAAFERVWLGSAGGIVYVIHPADVRLPDPPDPAEPNW
jgi:hypothetical protein